MPAKAILLDIEGTTTPLEFVTQVLFPYARKHAEEFLREHLCDEDMRACIESLRREHAADAARNLNPPKWRDDPGGVSLDSAVAYIHWLMDQDRKSTPLKSLQGRIWEAGFRSGELKGQVFADVPPAFSRWRKQGQTISIFSSGSVLAQKLLFRNTNAGDLTPFIRAYFDTTTGPKMKPASYSCIATALGLSPRDIFFLSDVAAELDAAKQAGILTALCIRPGHPDSPGFSHPIIHTFNEVFP